MTNPPMLPSSFSEQDAQRILARAAELEASAGGRLTIEDVRQIAAKAGIDATALEQAMIEATRSVEPAAVHDNSAPLITRSRVGMLAAVGALLGVTSIAADNLVPNTNLIVLGPSALYAAYLALRHPKGEGMISLMRELAVVFGSFSIAVILGGGLDATSPALGWSMLCGLLAGGIMAVRTSHERETTPVQAVTPVP